MKYLLFVTCLLFISKLSFGQYRDAPAQVDQELILELVNEARTNGCTCGQTRYAPVQPLIWHAQLEVAAQGHSNFMASRNRFSHTGRGGSKVGKRLSRTGYVWSYVGENIAAGQVSVRDVMRSWLESPGHCANIMNPNYIHMGVATKGPYWTQVFAKAQN